MPAISGPRSRRGLRRTGAAVAALAAAALVTGLTASPGASLTPDAQCPLAYPVSELSRGQAVTGLTVTSGTTPEQFEGEIIGVIHDGIAPGLDMVMASLTSPEIDRVGIWQGMSGSPVYAENGTLIGAVAYGLASGPSPVAGITPAQEMYRLLRDAPQDPSDQSVLSTAAGEHPVSIPPAMTSRLASSGVLARADAGAGMTRLPLPLTISGMVNANRLEQARKAFGLSRTHVHDGGAVTTSSEPIPIVAGGNLAASLSYGDVSAVGVGTATAVCGDEVLAFGHPMDFTGSSQLTMHGADAVYIQEDPLGSGFKVANATAPVGAISQDRLAGLVGLQRPDAVPATTRITSYAEVPGEWSRRGTTHISVPDAVPDISAFHLLSDEDRVLDRAGGGSATVGWRITGTRAHGRRFTLLRTDKYAVEKDLSYQSVLDLYSALTRLQFSKAEHVTIGTIRTTSVMSRTYQAYDVAKVRVLEAGHWRDLVKGRRVALRPGTTKRFQVLLTSDALPDRRVVVAVPVPRNIGKKSGVVRILGGNSSGSDQSPAFADDTNAGSRSLESLDSVLARLRHEPRNDQILTEVTLFGGSGSAQTRSYSTTAPAVVNGGATVRVRGLGSAKTPSHADR